MTDPYAFWSYDLYPFVLSAPVKSFRENGSVEPKGYDGFVFRPLLVVPGEMGRPLGQKLKELEREHAAATKKLNEEFKQKTRDAFVEAGLHLPKELQK